MRALFFYLMSMSLDLDKSWLLDCLPCRLPCSWLPFRPLINSRLPFLERRELLARYPGDPLWTFFLESWGALDLKFSSSNCWSNACTSYPWSSSSRSTEHRPSSLSSSMQLVVVLKKHLNGLVAIRHLCLLPEQVVVSIECSQSTSVVPLFPCGSLDFQGLDALEDCLHPWHRGLVHVVFASRIGSQCFVSVALLSDESLLLT
ncbi:MAG: hypothetical protein J3Q66DRAFT_346470 [Benniella sp.]|nr:MAG: hypothetical protein J3Q66DRAFT_346470 [Benniella sp.]